MQWWWQGRRRREQDLERELRSDLELEQAEQETRGLPTDEARHAAHRALGNAALVKEEVREMWGWTFFETMFQDTRYAARILRKSPGFAAVAVASLALGIGANTAVFSVLDAVLLKSLPVRSPGELRIFSWIRHGDPPFMKSHSGYNMNDERGRSVDGSFSLPALEAFRTLPQFSDVFGYAQYQFSVTAAGNTDLAFGHFVTGNYFTALGAQALAGRSILPDDDHPGRPRTAVITYEYWIRRFGSDPGVVNRVIQVNRIPVTVVGVMPRAFQGLQPGRAVDIFVPMSMLAEAGPAWYSAESPEYWWLQVFGRLKPGVPEQAAAAAAQQVFAHHIESYAGEETKHAAAPSIVLEAGGRGVALLRGSIGTAIYILSTVALIVLLIACASLANLLLARYSARSREVAIRVSIGASRGRLLRQMLAESFLLAGMGAIAGLLLAQPLFRVMLDLFAGTSTLGFDAHLDTRALIFTFAVSLATGILFGTIPAWRAARVSPAPALKESSAVLPGRGSRMLLGRGLVSFQIALSVLLVAGAGLFLRTLLNLAAVDLGFQPGHLLTFQTDPTRSGYEPAQAVSVFRRLEARIQAIPGVQSVGISQLPLMGGVVTNGPVRFPGSASPHQTWFLYCSNSFLSTMRIPVILGRDLNPADFDRSARTAVVNETFVRKYLSGANPVGTLFYPPKFDRKAPDPPPFTIVGVARDAHYRGVRDAAPPTAYMPYMLHPPGDNVMVFAVRTVAAPETIAQAVRRAVAEVDAHLPVAEMRTESEQIERSLGSERLFAALVSAFGAIALVLAAIGLYGIMAFSVSRRTSEIGIRLALGARRGDVQWMVLRQSLMMAALGIAIGLPVALEMSGLAAKLLYGVKPNDPLSLAAAIALIAVTAAIAAWIPALRASRVAPMRALRND